MTLRLLQIGLGNRGRMWAEIVAAQPGIEHSGIVDLDRRALERWAQERPDVPTFTDFATALRETRSDAALLVTPPDGHRAQAELIFRAGLPLLAEKPLALDLEDARAIVELGEAADVPLSVGLNFRYLPVSRKLRQLVADEALGTPGFGQFTYQRNRDGRRPGLNKYPLTMQHPMMLEQSIHHLDLIRYCYGREVEQVVCRTWNPPWSMYAHDSNVECLLTLEGGMEVSYLGTWTGGWDELRFEWRTDCADGVIVQRALFDDLAIARTTDAELRPVELPSCRAFYDDSAALLADFVVALRDNRTPPCSGRDHLRTLALCFAALESSASGRTVDVRDFAHRHGIEVTA